MRFDKDPFGDGFSDNPEVASLIEPLRAVRESLAKVEEALAVAMITIAKADCENTRKDNKCLEAISWVRDVSVEALNDLTTLRSGFAGDGSGKKAGSYPEAGGIMPPTPRQIAKSAAYLIAAVDDARLEWSDLPLIVQEALQALRDECEAAGLMARYIFPGHATYRVLD